MVTRMVGHFPTLMLETKDDKLQLMMASDLEPREVLRGHLGQTIVPSGDFVKKKSDDTLTVTWPDGNLRVTYNSFKNRCHRYDFYWTSMRPSKLVDAFDMSTGHWYGGAQVRKMLWPLDKWKFKMAPFVAEDSYKDGEYGGVQERYWLSSNGVAIFVHQAVPLFVGINEDGDKLLRFQTKFENPYRNHTKVPLTMRFSIFHAPDIMAAHKMVMGQNIDKPIDIPDVTMIRLPIWSTWAICKEDVDQNKVLSLANQILSHNIKTAQLEIDDDWAVHRGDWEFDRKKFPNPHEMTRRLKELGFRVTLWVHPFSNLKSKSIKKSDLFVRGQTRGATKWWNGIGRILDVTQPAAVEWYKKQLSHLKENYNLTSFKFDAGETNWLPKKWHLNRECNNPNIYTQKWAELAYELDKDWRAQEVRVGVRSQKLPIFVRMMDKDSSWSEKNGLQSIIPTALLYGVIGYPFFIPDMVGGNAYDERPSKQLFIRWVQVCALMPSIQFSLPPWWFDDRTVKITKEMLALRAKYADLLVELAKNATKTGAPIIRPLWWVDPKDDYALKCDDQFLVGNDLLVAPVVTENAKKRPVYLPKGRWRDEKSGKILEGRSWYFEYKVGLSDLPLFSRVKEDEAPSVTSTPAKAEDVEVVPVAPVIDADQQRKSSSSSSDDDTEKSSEAAHVEPDTADLIQFEESAPSPERQPFISELAESSDPTENLLDSESTQQAFSTGDILKPQPSVEDPISAVEVPDEPATPGVTKEDLKELDTYAPETMDEDNLVSDSSESETGLDDALDLDDFADLPPPRDMPPVLETNMDEVEDETNTLEGGGHLLSLLRRAKSVSEEVEDDLAEQFATLVTGKYRYSRLDDDFEQMDILSMISEESSLLSLELSDEKAPIARIDTYREESSSSDESDHETKEVGSQDVKELPVAVGIAVGTETPDFDTTAEAGLDEHIPADGATKELDSHIPLGDDERSSKPPSGGTSLYANVHVPRVDAGATSPDGGEKSLLRKIERKKKAPPEPVPGRLTLWDELTYKLKDRPKFDPEFGEVDSKSRTLAIQTSFDVLERDDKEDDSDSTSSESGSES